MSDPFEQQREEHHRQQTRHQKDIEIFNLHQTDTRKRLDTLAKMIVLISGGTLTLSLNIFLSDSRPIVSPQILPVLRYAWYSLFSSMLFFVLVLSIVVLASYDLGERWRKKLNDAAVDASGWHKGYRALLWLLGIAGILTFLYGMLSIMIVAVQVAAK